MIGQRLWTAVFTSVLASAGSAQNLVPNGSFEEYTACPTFFSDQFAVSWSSAWGTTDYYNTCATSGAQMAVPQNATGYQWPSEGEGYAGVITYVAPGAAPDPEHSREIIRVELAQPLTAGVPVSLSLKYAVALGGNQVGATPRYTCNGLGMRFSMGQPYDGLGPHPNSAVLYESLVPVDTANWISLQGVYIPDSSYTHLLLGNFFADSLLAPMLFDNSAQGYVAYAYIDEVCVSLGEGGCPLPTDLVDTRGDLLSVWPNPSTGVLHLRMPVAPVEFVDYTLVDALGRLAAMGRLRVNDSTAALDLTSIADGFYVLRITKADLHATVAINRATP